MAEPKIAGRSPFKVQLETGEHWWCACGESKSQPFCDGSHKGTSFSPVQIVIDEPKEVFLCGLQAHAQRTLLRWHSQGIGVERGSHDQGIDAMKHPRLAITVMAAVHLLLFILLLLSWSAAAGVELRVAVLYRPAVSFQPGASSWAMGSSWR